MNLVVRKTVGSFLRSLPISRVYGSCYRCGVPWNYTTSHTTLYNAYSGCFPLCEECWSALTIEERLPFYQQLYNTWGEQGELILDAQKREEYQRDLWGKWALIEAAVQAGK